MEKTEEERKKYNEYQRNWRENNSEKIERNTQKFYESHPNYAKNYYKEYYKVHKDDIRKKQALWRELNAKMDTVYLFEDKRGQTLYIGSSSRFKERMSAHCTANSNLKMSAKEMIDKYNLSMIIYKDFSKYNLSRDDLFFIESYFKENIKEIIKTNAVNYNEKNLTRSKEELTNIATKQVVYKKFVQMDRYLN